MGSVPMLTSDEVKVIRQLRDDGIFTDAPKLPGRLVALMCGDGRRAKDKLIFIDQQCHHEDDKCTHVVAANGGALGIAKHSPLAVTTWGGEVLRHDHHLLQQIAESVQLQGANTVLLKTHFPCGKAREHGLSIQEVLHFHAEGAFRVQQILGREVDVVCLAHVDYHGHRDCGLSRHRTYGFDPKHFS